MGTRFGYCKWYSRRYMTEKLPDALLAGVVPIYWGAPDVAATFNPRSFVHVRGTDARAIDGAAQRGTRRGTRRGYSKGYSKGFSKGYSRPQRSTRGAPCTCAAPTRAPSKVRLAGVSTHGVLEGVLTRVLEGVLEEVL